MKKDELKLYNEYSASATAVATEEKQVEVDALNLSYFHMK